MKPRIGQSEDVKRAVAWIRENIASYGGDPAYVAITGGSAGGHLTALTALTPNEKRWQPGLLPGVLVAPCGALQSPRVSWCLAGQALEERSQPQWVAMLYVNAARLTAQKQAGDRQGQGLTRAGPPEQKPL